MAKDPKEPITPAAAAAASVLSPPAKEVRDYELIDGGSYIEATKYPERTPITIMKHAIGSVEPEGQPRDGLDLCRVVLIGNHQHRICGPYKEVAKLVQQQSTCC